MWQYIPGGILWIMGILSMLHVPGFSVSSIEELATLLLFALALIEFGRD